MTLSDIMEVSNAAFPLCHHHIMTLLTKKLSIIIKMIRVSFNRILTIQLFSIDGVLNIQFFYYNKFNHLVSHAHCILIIELKLKQ